MKKKRTSLARFLFYCCWKGFTVLVVLSGLGIFLFWMGFSRVGDFRETIENRVSHLLHLPTKIGTMYTGWHGLHPYVGLQDIRILSADGQQILFQLGEAEVELDLLESLRRQQFTHGHISLIGLSLEMQRESDGRIALFSKKKSSTKKTAALDLKWLAVLGQQKIGVKSGSLLIHDAISRHDYAFRNIEAELKLTSTALQLKGFSELPDQLGSNSTFFVDLKGDLQRTETLGGRVYIKGRRLKQKGWATLFPEQMAQVPEGLYTAEIWFDVKQQKIENAMGKLQVSGLARHRGFEGYRISTQFDWEPSEDRQSLHIKNLVVDNGQDKWPSTTARIDLIPTQSGHEIEVGASFLRLDDIDTILQHLPFFKPPERLQHNHLQGDLSQIYTHFTVPDEPNGKITKFLAQAEFTRLGLDSSSSSKLPHIRNLEGRFNLDQSGGHVFLDSRSSEMEYSGVFKQMIPIDRLKAHLEIELKDDFWAIEGKNIEMITPGIQVVGDFRLRSSHLESSPYLDLAMHVGKGRIDQVSNYLPTGIMKPKLSKWLAESLRGGQVIHGNVIFRGLIGDFPFRKNEGRFGILLQLTDGVLRYADGWPILRSLDGQLLFDGVSLSADLDGRVLHSRLNDIRLDIADLSSKKVRLKINGHAKGLAQDGLDHLTKTPLKAKMGPMIEQLSFDQGSMDLDLTLDYPLYQGGAVSVSGDSHIRNGRLRVDTGPQPLLFEKTVGVLSFTETQLSAKGLQTVFRDIPGEVDVHTEFQPHKDGRQKKTIFIEGQGRFSPQDAARITGFPWGQWIKGSALWKSILKFDIQDPKMSTLTFQTDMQGLDVQLPEPFTKIRERSSPLKIERQFSGEILEPWKIQYGQILQGAMVLNEQDEEHAIRRANFSLNNPAKLPATDEIVISGKTEKLSWESWSRVIDSLPENTSGFQPIRIDLEADKVEAFQRRIEKAMVQAENAPDHWKVTLHSRDVAGTLNIPSNPSLAIKAKLDHLHLKDSQLLPDLEALAEKITPADMSPIDLDVQEMTYNDMKLGHMNLLASRRPDALMIDHLESNTAATQITGTGAWTRDLTGRQSSVVDLSIHSQNAAATLSEWQYTQGLDGGSGEARVNINWAGSPRDFSLAAMKGDINFQLRNGRILDIDPGAGRIFGLLSLQTLTKRLSLDFSDIFNKGFSFDKISGQFSVHDGNAYTDNFTIEGPAAKMAMSGRVGLVKKDYNQKLTIIPQVGSSLPLAGALAGGVGVGAAVFVIQKIFEPQIDKAVSIQYSVTGDWSNPVITKIQRNKKESKR